jgi:hypothetical protein
MHHMESNSDAMAAGGQFRTVAWRPAGRGPFDPPREDGAADFQRMNWAKAFPIGD